WMVQEEHSAHAYENSGMAATAKGTETRLFFFMYCWTSLFRSQLLFQSTIRKVEMVENITLYCFYSLHHLLSI
ncbi:hypothetical protein VIGAN_03114300, partial [Vigna angularis var. angularis]